jgi:hypothetical protein
VFEGTRVVKAAGGDLGGVDVEEVVAVGGVDY